MGKKMGSDMETVIIQSGVNYMQRCMWVRISQDGGYLYWGFGVCTGGNCHMWSRAD